MLSLKSLDRLIFNTHEPITNGGLTHHIEHRNAESEGLRFDCSNYSNLFSSVPCSPKVEGHIYLHFTTKLRNYLLFCSIYSQVFNLFGHEEESKHVLPNKEIIDSSKPLISENFTLLPKVRGPIDNFICLNTFVTCGFHCV